MIKVIPILVLAGSLASCNATTGGLMGASSSSNVDTATHPRFVDMVPNVNGDRLNDPWIRAGLQALDDKNLQVASKAFNRALKFGPTDPNLHFLNALTYHLMAAQGDASQLDMAKVGYDLALRYDPSNFWAAYQLGQISFTEQRYREAQDAFAYALQFDEENVDILRGLATASYYAQDLDTALAAIEKADALQPGNADISHDAALFYAAAGEDGPAQVQLALYNAAVGNVSAFRKTHLKKRMADWLRFHREQGGLLHEAQSTTDVLGKDVTAPIMSAGAAQAVGGTPGQSGAVTIANDKLMTLVDVIIIRSEERMATSKGVNLLNGLSSTLSGTLWSASDVRTINRGAANSRQTAFTINPSFSISASYSLNIFNDNYDKNEVMARPTLVAQNNKQSSFFSGSIFHVELQNAYGGQGQVQPVPVGVKLEVTPKFYSPNEVELNVTAARAFIEAQATHAGFTKFTQTTENTVTANVTMKFGDTLVLSGMSEKATENLRDGVPLLQDIPIIQYLFSNQNTLDFTKSIVILLTPRKPRYTLKDGTDKIDLANPADADIMQSNLDELMASKGWSKPVDNLDSVFWHLKDSKFFKEFRSGDVRMEKWNYPDRLERMTKRAVQFLYY